MQHNTWGKDRDLLAEAVSKVFSEQHDPTREVKDGETVGHVDQFIDKAEDQYQFIDKAEKFVDAIGDSELEFLMNLSTRQFEVLMQIVKEEHGYRNAPRN